MPRRKTYPVRFSQEELEFLAYIVGHAKLPFAVQNKEMQDDLLRRFLTNAQEAALDAPQEDENASETIH